MNYSATFIPILFAAIVLPAHAGVDHGYYGIGFSSPKIEVYNDGHDTFIESIAGLTIDGASKVKNRYQVKGLPYEIKGSLNGSSIAIKRGSCRAMQGPAVSKTPAICLSTIRQGSVVATSDMKNEADVAVLGGIQGRDDDAITLLPKSIATISPKTESNEQHRDLVPRITRINRGDRFDIVLTEYAAQNGWGLYWYPYVTWKSLGEVDLAHYKTVVDAVSDIVIGLRDEGKPIQLRISEGNHVMEVLSTEENND